MTTLTVRRLQVDLDTPIARHWNGGDAFRTAFFNALSMSFPAGEQIFFDALKDHLSPSIEFISMDCHINDSVYSQKVTDTALMPHPERVFRNVQMSDRGGGDISAPCPWMRMFHNARAWLK